MIQRNYTKSFDGLKNRVLAKVTAFTLVQFYNLTQKKHNFNNIKASLDL